MSRFRDLRLKRPLITFLVDPFNSKTDYLKVPIVSDEAATELEMIDLCEEANLSLLQEKKLLHTVNVWVNIVYVFNQCLRVYVFNTKTRKIKASICTD